MKFSLKSLFQFKLDHTMKVLALILLNCGLFVSFMPYLNILRLSTLFDSVRRIVNEIASDTNCTEVPNVQVQVSSILMIKNENKHWTFLLERLVAKYRSSSMKI